MVDIIGRKVESKPDEVFVEREDGVYAFPKRIDSLETGIQINSQDYALVQEGDKAVSAISMKQNYNGNSQRDTIVRVLKDGLIVPRASRFVRQLMNVGEAREGRRVLYDASGNLIEGDRLKQYANILFHNNWVWSPESFRESKKGEEGFLDLDVVRLTGLDKQGNPVYQAEPLERCLEQSCYADLESMNSQGFLTRKSKTQAYQPGKNIHFYPPVEGGAVRFGADSYSAYFSGNWYPLLADDRLGVFACAFGTQKNLGDK